MWNMISDVVSNLEEISLVLGVEGKESLCPLDFGCMAVLKLLGGLGPVHATLRLLVCIIIIFIFTRGYDLIQLGKFGIYLLIDRSLGLLEAPVSVKSMAPYAKDRELPEEKMHASSTSVASLRALS